MLSIMIENIIEIENLNKKIKGNLIIKNVNLKIKKGEKIGIVGANGSGKTTLVEMISGVVKPTSGQIIINSDMPANRKIGLQFQEGYWPIGVNIKSIIKYYVGAKHYNNLKKEQLLEIFGVNKILNKELKNLSGGEKQRFNAVLSIINKPDILILDELITGLDLKMQIRLLDYFKNYVESNNKTLIMVSHIPEEVQNLCQRFMILENGAIVYDLQVSEVIKKSGSIRKFLENYYNQLGT